MAVLYQLSVRWFEGGCSTESVSKCVLSRIMFQLTPAEEWAVAPGVVGTRLVICTSTADVLC